MTDFKIRPAQGDDLNFIYKSTLDSYRYDSHLGKSCKNSIFYPEYQKVLDTILGKSDTKVLVACKPDEENIIFGYLIYEPLVLHYAFVKEAFRHYNIAKSLFTEAFGDGSVTIQVTHQTKSIGELIRDHPQLVFNPFLLYKQTL